jgi:hypothetical protein
MQLPLGVSQNPYLRTDEYVPGAFCAGSMLVERQLFILQFSNLAPYLDEFGCQLFTSEFNSVSADGGHVDLQ